MIEKITTIKELGKIKASDIMTTPVTTVHVWDSIHDVAKIFIENNISSAAVVDLDDVPLGVITKTDLARYDCERAGLVVAEKDKTLVRKGFHVEPEETTIEHWMTPAFLDVKPDTILAAVVKKMVRNGLHHVFVTEGEKKKIKGIITTFDLLLLLQRKLNPE
jgi:CBS domain-containing protein